MKNKNLLPTPPGYQGSPAPVILSFLPVVFPVCA